MDQNLLRDAYFAGVIDGDGCVYLHSKGERGVRPIVQVSMTCEATVTAMRNHFDAGTVRPVRQANERSQRQWRWRVYYNDAREVLRRTMPFLIAKRAAAEAVLAHVPQTQRGSIR